MSNSNISIFLPSLKLPAFKKVLEKKISSEEVDFHIDSQEEDDSRDLNEFLYAVFLPGVTAGIMANIITTLSLQAFSELYKKNQLSKSKAVLELKNGVRLEIPASLNEEELNNLIKWVVDNGGINNIIYN